jgi:hypothetical protein
MSGHLSEKRKKDFNYCLTARKKDFVFFVGLLNKMGLLKTDTGNYYEDMVIYRRSSSVFQSC